MLNFQNFQSSLSNCSIFKRFFFAEISAHTIHTSTSSPRSLVEVVYEPQIYEVNILCAKQTFYTKKHRILRSSGEQEGPHPDKILTILLFESWAGAKLYSCARAKSARQRDTWFDKLSMTPDKKGVKYLTPNYVLSTIF